MRIQPLASPIRSATNFIDLDRGEDLSGLSDMELKDLFITNNAAGYDMDPREAVQYVRFYPEEGVLTLSWSEFCARLGRH